MGSAGKSLTRVWNFTDQGGMRSQGKGGLEVENLSAGIVWDSDGCPTASVFCLYHLLLSTHPTHVSREERCVSEVLEMAGQSPGPPDSHPLMGEWRPLTLSRCLGSNKEVPLHFHPSEA